MLDQMAQLLFGDCLSAFFNPQKRIFWGYLLSALFIALCWLFFAKKTNLKDSLKQVFSFQSWLSKSARADYLLMILNGIVMALLSPRLLGKTAVAALLFGWLHSLFDGRALIGENITPEVIAMAFTLFLFVFDDLARYWLHRWLHTSPVLWSFHKVHHSATSLNPLTVFRTHPVEAVLFSIRGALVQGISVAIFIYFFGDKVTLVTVLGAGLFNFMFNIMGANLRHSAVSIRFWKPVERVFMSPAQHHIHHSYAPEHIDKNYGVVFSFWDYCFGSHCFSTKDQTLSYGLSSASGDEQHNIKALYLAPFKEAGLSILAYARPMLIMVIGKQSKHTHYKGSS